MEPSPPNRFAQWIIVAVVILGTIFAGWLAICTEYGTLGIYVLAVVGIPAGIYYGTQNKDYWA